MSESNTPRPVSSTSAASSAPATAPAVARPRTAGQFLTACTGVADRSSVTSAVDDEGGAADTTRGSPAAVAGTGGLTGVGTAIAGADPGTSVTGSPNDA